MFQILDNAAAFFLSGAGDGEQDFFHAVAVDERLDVVRTIDGEVVDDGAADFGVVVNEGDGGVFVNLFDGFQQLAAGLSCTVDDDGHHLFLMAVGQDGTQNHARTGNTDDQQQEINDGQGKVQLALKNQGSQAEQDCRNEAAECGSSQDAGTDEAGNGSVQPQFDKQRDGQKSSRAEGEPVRHACPFVRILGFKALSKPKGDKNHQKIMNDEEDFFDVAG
ncbi:hypothetical protein NEIMUCOT_05457 [Neisseria mucosa ATCC 25996]|uniref:Uncharacterized protein n=1 Tax=Neisseria mucosa (strain ATCC 25996 / DSM 4631 / NCTC 10774 / M26) TaxID=546266 RepID=D2ZXV3_NEIM2|nr:hypothetical protein NEIMUCOT_05457 [Neisseria mucosa ATCC 25996]